MTLSLVEKITNRENFYWAWEKLKFSLKSGDGWYNEIEFAEIEANLENTFDQLIQQIASGSYNLSPLSPIGYPKLSGKGESKTRQMFIVSLRDQLVWIALVNIIGSYLDKEMPFWSYGNRLHIPVFYDSDNKGKKQIKFGWYRNTSGYIYRKWHQSWPRFRKHITVTIKRMSQQALMEKEQEEVDANDSISGVLESQLKCLYIIKEFWDHKLSAKVYWASIDFQKFYPNAKIKTVKKNILDILPAEQVSTEFVTLVNALCDFKIDYTGWTKDELREIDLDPSFNSFPHIPTGLFVAGFLANVLLIKIDKEVHNEVLKRKNIAHFRFVDDHVILADNFGSLVDWIHWYTLKLEEYDCGASINLEKTEPQELCKHLDSSENDFKTSAADACQLDPLFPSPLMTQTLSKISMINGTDFELLSDGDKERFVDDVEHLLLADFNEEEIKKDTRLSFAATVLTRILPKKNRYDVELGRVQLKLIKKSRDLKHVLSKDTKDKANVDRLQNEIGKLLIEKDEIETRIQSKYEKEFQRVMHLLSKVIYENYDKVRLWRRAFEFCLNSGVEDGIDCLLNIIAKLEENKRASNLTISYLYTLSLNLLNELIFRAYRIIREKQYTHLEKQRAKSFLIQAIRYEPKNDERFAKFLDQKPYNKLSTTLFNKSRNILVFTIRREREDENWHIILNQLENDGFRVDNAFENLLGLHPEAVVWSFTRKLHIEKDFIPVYWREAINNIPNRNSPLFLLYPTFLTIEALNRLDIEVINKGWLVDYLSLSAGSILPKGHQSLEWINEILEKPTLIRWVSFQNRRESFIIKQSATTGCTYFDPRLSEWTALEIVAQVAELSFVSRTQLDFFFNETDIDSIHPANFLLPWDWMEGETPTWHEWQVKVKDGIQRTDAKLIHDSRYTPTHADAFGINDSIADDAAILQGLGTMLVGLLRKDLQLPQQWNLAGHQRIWLNAILLKLNDVSVSSLTKQILLSIFSKRNRETKLLKIFQSAPDYEFKEDTILDPNPIEDLQQLILLLRQSQKILEQYRINVDESEPRQLIPVSLKQLTKEYNPYENFEQSE